MLGCKSGRNCEKTDFFGKLYGPRCNVIIITISKSLLFIIAYYSYYNFIIIIIDYCLLNLMTDPFMDPGLLANCSAMNPVTNPWIRILELWLDASINPRFQKLRFSINPFMDSWLKNIGLNNESIFGSKMACRPFGNALSNWSMDSIIGIMVRMHRWPMVPKIEIFKKSKFWSYA